MPEPTPHFDTPDDSNDEPTCELCSQPQTARYHAPDHDGGIDVCGVHANALESGTWIKDTTVRVRPIDNRNRPGILVSVYTTPFGADGDRGEVARDIRTFRRTDMVTPDVFQNVYELAASGYLPAYATDVDITAATPHERAEVVYRRCQGGRGDPYLDYDGGSQRSLCPGDIIVIDATAYFVATAGFVTLGPIAELLQGGRDD